MNWIIGMHESWFSGSGSRAVSRFLTVESGFSALSVSAIHWFALEFGPQNWSSFLLETGEWVNGVTCLNPVESGRGARALKVLKSCLSPVVVLGSSALVVDVASCLSSEFESGTRMMLSLRIGLINP